MSKTDKTAIIRDWVGRTFTFTPYLRENLMQFLGRSLAVISF